MNLTQKYYIKSLTYSKTRFIFELTFSSLVIKFILAFIMGVIAFKLNIEKRLLHQDFGNPFNKSNYIYLIPFFVLIIPFLETLTQWLPIKLLKKITNNYLAILLTTALIFSLMHISRGIFYSILIFPSGLALSWCFYCKYKISFGEAFFNTFMIHSLHNIIAILFIIYT